MLKAKYVLGMLAAVAFAVSANAKELQLLGNGRQVLPIRVAPATMVDGEVVIGEWMAYHQKVEGCFTAEYFDAFDPDGAGVPEDEDGCGLGSGRWWFGETYTNLTATNDMGGTNGQAATADSFAWSWQCGLGNTEQCVVVVFTGETWSGDCGGFADGYDGVAYDFGDLACNPGGYYYTNVTDLDDVGLSHQLPASGNTGWYQVQYRTADGTVLATSAQPMLWGTGATRPGTSDDTNQWDDDAPADGAYTANECYPYDYGVCPSPDALCAAQSFGDGSGNCQGACDAEVTKVKGKTKSGNCSVTAKGTDPTPGDTFTVTLSNGDTKDATANDRGKWKAKFKNVGTTGDSFTAEACGSEGSAVCP
jgi:hypothetical protein